ncbi:MAG: hotdog fold thioesterase, partial [Rhodocyclaceae bacterium]|nr:hotdog fold thioesterase [Rhodocyclaceae bacterium]
MPPGAWSWRIDQTPSTTMCFAWASSGNAPSEQVDAYDSDGANLFRVSLRAVRSGAVTGRATPLHLGRTTQVWSIDIRDDQDRRVCIARLTMAVIAKERAP